jgi:hypothetical protein
MCQMAPWALDNRLGLGSEAREGARFWAGASADSTDFALPSVSLAFGRTATIADSYSAQHNDDSHCPSLRTALLRWRAVLQLSAIRG